ncbi:hypothetical protein [Lactococcus garvieae]|uniref:hypothetical protein n=1 Tax=Lactococcus garvieae TaxID=1363 RepID=UPI00254D069E|nr:hypothetical protein [Lactococcus garvieae]
MLLNDNKILDEGNAMTYNQHSTAQHSTAQHSTAQHSTARGRFPPLFACPKTLWTTGAFFPSSDP